MNANQTRNPISKVKPQAWNTGRQYTAEGQRIAARVDELTDSILFNDIDRIVFGRIEGASDLFNPESESLRSFVMRHYDHGSYYTANSDPALFALALALA